MTHSPATVYGPRQSTPKIENKFAAAQRPVFVPNIFIWKYWLGQTNKHSVCVGAYLCMCMAVSVLSVYMISIHVRR